MIQFNEIIHNSRVSERASECWEPIHRFVLGSVAGERGSSLLGKDEQPPSDKIRVEISLRLKQRGREKALKDGDVRAVFHDDFVLGSSEGNLDCVGGGGYHRSVGDEGLKKTNA